jgi:uncharacterized repeat protein (TIGR03809 family)
MPTVQGAPRFDRVVRQWRYLAERRLRDYTELYRSGRWRHYYTQEQFRLRMFDVVRAVKIWRELAGRPRVGQPAGRDDKLRPAA